MAKFCNKCGAPLIPGQPHICPADQSAPQEPTAAGTPGGPGPNGFGGQTGGPGPNPGNFGGQTGGPGPNPGNFGGQPGGPGPNPGNFGGQPGGPGPNPGNFGGQPGGPGPNPGNFGGQTGGPGPNPGNFGGQAGGPGPNPGNFGGQTGGPGPNPGNFGGQAGGPGPNAPQGQQPPVYQPGSLSQWWMALMSRIGVGDPESNSDGVYERGMQIAPDNLTLNEGEVPIRQYDVAVLRSRLKLQRAEGRLQITNKRLLFRATGRSVRGKTTLQHEFALDDMKGFEIHKDYRFSFLDLLAALVCVAVVGTLFGAMVTALFRCSAVVGAIFGLLLGAASVVPFFLMYRRFFLKLLCSAAGTMSVFPVFMLSRMAARYAGGGWGFLLGLSGIVLVCAFVVLIAGLFLFCFKPNLVFDFKTMGGGAPIQIRRKTGGFFGMPRMEYSGFNEVLPAADTERALQEVGALINDIQKLGDRAIEQWKDRP